MLAKAEGKKGRPSVHPIEQAKDARAVMQAGDKFQLLFVRIRKGNFRGKIMQQVSARSISAFFYLVIGNTRSIIQPGLDSTAKCNTPRSV